MPTPFLVGLTAIALVGLALWWAMVNHPRVVAATAVLFTLWWFWRASGLLP